jgi:hypothetical protein
MKPTFRVDQKDNFWIVDVYYVTHDQESLFADWNGFEEPFNEETYQKMSGWCYNQFKTWLKPKRARRMGYTQFWFQSKKDLDWFVLYWSAVDIPLD